MVRSWLRKLSNRIRRVRASTAWAVFLGVFWGLLAYTGALYLLTF